jgi:hypothetical protein
LDSESTINGCRYPKIDANSADNIFGKLFGGNWYWYVDNNRVPRQGAHS